MSTDATDFVEQPTDCLEPEPQFTNGRDLERGNDLPEDALLRICKYTETEDLFPFAQTCRHFYQIVINVYFERHGLPMEGYGVGNIVIRSMVLFRIIPRLIFIPPINRLKTSLRFPCVTVPELLLDARSTLTHINRIQEKKAEIWEPPAITPHEPPEILAYAELQRLPYAEREKHNEKKKRLSTDPPPAPPKLTEFTLHFQPEYAGNKLFRLLLENSIDRKVELRTAFQKLFITIFSTIEKFTLKDGMGMTSLLDPKNGIPSLSKVVAPEDGPSPVLTKPVLKTFELHSPIFLAPLLRTWGASLLKSSSVSCLSIRDPDLKHNEWSEWLSALEMPSLETLIIDRCALRMSDLCEFLNRQPGTHTLHLRAPLSEDFEYSVPDLTEGAQEPPRFFTFEHVKTLVSLPDYLNQFLGPKYDFKSLEEVAMSMWVETRRMFQWDNLLALNLEDPAMRNMDNITLTIQLDTEHAPPRQNLPAGVEEHHSVYWLGGTITVAGKLEETEKVKKVCQRITKAKLKWFSFTAPNALREFYIWIMQFPNMKTVEFVGSVKSEMWAHSVGSLRKQYESKPKVEILD